MEPATPQTSSRGRMENGIRLQPNGNARGSSVPGRDEAERSMLTYWRLNSRVWSGLRTVDTRWTGTAQPVGFSRSFATKTWIGRLSINLSAWRAEIQIVSRSRI